MDPSSFLICHSGYKANINVTVEAFPRLGKTIELAKPNENVADAGHFLLFFL